MTWDVIIIGAGIAGASIGCFLAPHRRVLILERESQPGYHTTGRSAAVFSATYGPPLVRQLSRASLPFYRSPPPPLGEHPLLTPRRALLLAEPGQETLIDDTLQALGPHAAALQRLDAAAALALVPALRPERVAGALLDPEVADIDVHALHHGMLHIAKRRGAQVHCNADVQSLERTASGWTLRVSGQTLQAAVVVNAAGAWADVIAGRAGIAPLALQPKRRSAFTFALPADIDARAWPMVLGLDESWYMKPDAGQMLASPANADPSPPMDALPEAIEIATGIHRLHEMTTFDVRRPSHTWAGLRSFLPDGAPVAGWAPDCPTFFWLAGHGGYGLQTAPALGAAAAAIALNTPLPDALLAEGLSVESLSPCRLTASPARPS